MLPYTKDYERRSEVDLVERMREILGQSKPDPSPYQMLRVPDQPWPEGSVDPHVPNAQPSAVLILMCVRRLWREVPSR